MAARREVETHERVARLQQRQEHRLIGLRSGIGLNIGESAAEQRLGPLDRQGPRRCRRTGSRRNSAGPDSLRRICSSSPSPAPRARRATRCFRTRSARSRRAGGRVRVRCCGRSRDRLTARLAPKKLLDSLEPARSAACGETTSFMSSPPILIRAAPRLEEMLVQRKTARRGVPWDPYHALPRRRKRGSDECALAPDALSAIPAGQQARPDRSGRPTSRWRPSPCRSHPAGRCRRGTAPRHRASPRP